MIADVRTMEQALNETVAQPRLNLGLLGAFSALALVMAVLGAYRGDVVCGEPADA